ncbi:MAG TPA: glycosyltransferase, partial [Euryarchaeota archaeon]|nr:glycosyltransferase [Euryarchaeota archaeon]
VVYAGGLNAERDMELLITAFNRVYRERGVRLLLFGHGESSYVKNIMARVQGGSVIYGGNIPYDQVNSFLDLSLIGVVTYQKNPLTVRALPTKVFEYARLEKTMVLPRLGELERVFADSAYFYEVGNADDLTEKLILALDNRGKFTDKALERVKPYEWDIMQKRLLALYKELREELDL